LSNGSVGPGVRTTLTGSRAAVGVAVAVVVIGGATSGPILDGQELALKLRASLVGANVQATTAPLTIELLRWSTDAERAPFLTALAPPPPAPAAPAAGQAAGRGGRGGRGAAPPLSPAARLTAAVKAAPSVGFIWSDGPTGYSIRYAWRTAQPDGRERVVLVTDRRLGAHSTTWPQPAEAVVKAGDAEFTVVELRIDGKGVGEAKTSLASPVIVDPAAKTVALGGYDTAPALLKVTR
jgi:hypothetical protein